MVVKNRGQGVHNDNAMFRKPVTVDDVLASKVVCEPLHLFMLCSPNEGAAAVVLCAGTGGVQLRAAALRSHLPGHVLNEGSPLSGLVGRDPTPPTALAAADAYAAAGLGPDDIDVAECQDTDAARELLAYEELAFCAPGECGKLVDEGATAMGGRIHAARHPADDDQPVHDQVRGEAFCHAGAVRRRMARAHHRDAGPGEYFHIAADKEHDRRIVDFLEPQRVFGITQGDDFRAHLNSLRPLLLG